MAVRENDEVPEFYKDYVKYVQQRIEENARLECELIFRENELTKVR
jgi:glutamate dehydrogenase